MKSVEFMSILEGESFIFQNKIFIKQIEPTSGSNARSHLGHKWVFDPHDEVKCLEEVVNA